MNAHSRTLSLPGAARPMRERGSSALDRAVIVWPAPDPSARVLETWGAPTGRPVVSAGIAPWAPPDPVMRFDLPAPDAFGVPAPADGSIRRTDLVEPRHDVAIPDIASASLAAITTLPTGVPSATTPVPVVEQRVVESVHPQLRSAKPRSGQPLHEQSWPAPTLATAASFDPMISAPAAAPVSGGPDRSGITPRLIVGLAAVAGALVAGAAALISLL